MKYLILVAVAVVFTSLKVTYGLENVLELYEGSDVRQGNCSTASLDNLVLFEHTNKTAHPSSKRSRVAYIKSFSAALRYEYGGYGITIQHLAPMFINTKMNAFSKKLQKNNFFVPDAEEYAKYAVMTLGKIDDSSGYWTHGIQTFFTKIPPVWLRMYVGAQLNISFRKDYFREKQSTNNNTNTETVTVK